MTTYAASPGGWQNLKSVQIAKVLYVGTASVLAALYLFGNLTIRGSATVHGNITGYNITATGSVIAPTASIQTLSGKTLKLKGGLYTITDNTQGWLLGNVSTLTGGTLSGRVLKAGGGDLFADNNVLNASGSLTVAGTSSLRGGVNISATTYPGLYIFGTATGNVIHGEKWLTSSGALKVVGASTLTTTTVTTLTASSTLSGASSLTLSKAGGHTGAVLCLDNQGKVGWHAIAASGAVVKTAGCQPF